jgi:Tfp pilus assembly protein PilO
MKKIDKKTFTGVAVVGLVVLVALYMLVFQKYSDKTSALQRSNTTLRAEVTSIKQYYDNRETYRQNTEEIRTAMNELVAQYPADAREEDVLMMGVDMQSVSGIEYDEINIDTAEVLYSIPQEDVTAAGVEELNQAIDFVERKATYSGELNYTDLRSCIQQIYSYPSRIAINNVALTKKETTTDDVVTSFLTGNIDVSFYSMTGTGREYEAPDMAEYTSGTSNPFQLVIESQ